MIAASVLVAFCVAGLFQGTEGVTIIVPRAKLIVVEFGQELTLWCNFSYTSSENGDNRVEASLNLNDTNIQKLVYNYEQNGRNGGNDYVPALQNHFESRTDILELREPLAIGLKIQHAQWNDSGNYTWTMTVDRLRGSSQQNVHTNEVIVGRKPTSAFLHYTRIDDTTYKLVCNIGGGKPTPTITIFNDTNIIYTLVSDVSASVTLNITSKSVYYCTAANTLGSASSDPVQLPESGTALPSFTSNPEDSGVTEGPVYTTDSLASHFSSFLPAGDSGVSTMPDDTGKTAGIVIGTLLGLLVAVILTGFILYKRLYKKESLLPDRNIFRQRKQKASNDHVYEMPASVLDVHVQPYAEVAADDQLRELTANDIRLLETIGHGHFGEVYKAMLKNINFTNTEKTVAVKLLKEQYSEVDKKEFCREIETMQLVPQHENVVAMLGFCKTAARAFLVLEYLGNGNLKTYLRKSRSNNIYGNLHGGSGKLTSQNLLSFALGSASGMAHIAKYKFLHRDLAARNILVSDTMVCKVSDFGLARDVIDSREYLSRMETPLPIRWMAPESISDSVYTTKSDVWSFGVLLWEIATLGATPYPGITSGRELIREIRSGYRMEKPQHCTQELYNMMMMCWEEEPTERPTFDNLVTSLRGMANEEIKLHVDVDRAAEAVYCDIDSQLVGEIV